MVDRRHLLPLDDAARLVGLQPATLADLAAAGFLPHVPAAEGILVAHSDVRALGARLGEATTTPPELELEASFAELDPQALLDELGQRSGEMAERAMDLLAAVVPEAAGWTPLRRAAVAAEAKARFEVLVALAAVGPSVGQDAIDELASLGTDASWGEQSLVQSLLTLRLSRDLLVQSAVELAERHGRRWGLALSVVLTRIVPTVDRLTDAVVRGHWQAVLHRQAEGQARYANVVEGSSDGVYEVSVDGHLLYVNAAFAVIVGRSRDELVGRPLVDVLGARAETIRYGGHAELRIARPDGVERVLDVRVVERRRPDGWVAGYDGVVRDRTARVLYEALRQDLVALVTDGVRAPADAVVEATSSLDELARAAASAGVGVAPHEVVGHTQAVRRELGRVVRRTGALVDLGAVADGSLSMFRTPVDVCDTVGRAVGAALGWTDTDPTAVHVEVEPDLTVLADAARFEQVVANLVDNALRYGAAPVEVIARATDDHDPHGPQRVVIEVRDRGNGVARQDVDRWFAQLRLPGDDERPDPRPGTIGLALVRGLVEAMGGTVWYESPPGGGACFGFTVPRLLVAATQEA